MMPTTQILALQSAGFTIIAACLLVMFKQRGEILKKKVLYSRGSPAAFLSLRQVVTLHTALLDLRVAGSFLLMLVGVLFLIIGAGEAHQANNLLPFILSIPAGLAFVTVGLNMGPWMKRFIITEGGIIDDTIPVFWKNVKQVELVLPPMTTSGLTVILEYKFLGFLPNSRRLSDIEYIHSSDYNDILSISHRYMPAGSDKTEIQ